MYFDLDAEIRSKMAIRIILTTAVLAVSFTDADTCVIAMPEASRTESRAAALLQEAFGGKKGVQQLHPIERAHKSEYFTLWTTGLKVKITEEEDHPPEIGCEDYGDDTYCPDPTSGEMVSEWNSFDRFAGAKTHTTHFVGFVDKPLPARLLVVSNLLLGGDDFLSGDNYKRDEGWDDAHDDEAVQEELVEAVHEFELDLKMVRGTVKPCPVASCGDKAIAMHAGLEDSALSKLASDNILGIFYALTGRHALDTEYMEGEPDYLDMTVCTGGCVFGSASIDLHMVGKLGWAPAHSDY